MDNISKSFEDYLETIYLIKKRKKVVKVKNIAQKLEVALPSVTEAIRNLAELNLVTYKRYGLINLTTKGERFAKEVYKKHEILFLFLTKILKVDEKIAIKEACAIEHNISKLTLKKLTKFVNVQNIKNL